MTRAQFRDFAKLYVEYQAQPYPIDDTAWNTVINEGLQKYSELTGCIFGEAVVTVPIGGRFVDYREEGLFNVFSVESGGEVIRNNAGGYEPTTVDDFSYLSSSDAGPIEKWTVVDSTSILVYPKPAVAQDITLRGLIVHPELTSDSDEILIKHSHIRTAAVMVAALASIPRAEGSILDRMMKISEFEANNLARIMKGANKSRGAEVDA